MKPSSAKAKGRLLQQWVRDLLYELFPSLQDGDVRSTSMGAGGEDVLLSPLARSLVPVSIECKNIAKFVGYNFYDQAVDNAGEHEPVVVVKANRRDPLVLVDARYFFERMADEHSQDTDH